MSHSEDSTDPGPLICPVCSSNVWDGDCLRCGCPRHIVAHESPTAWAANWLEDRETQARIRRHFARVDTPHSEIRPGVVRALKAAGRWLTDAEIAELMDDAAVLEYFERVKRRVAGEGA